MNDTRLLPARFGLVDVKWVKYTQQMLTFVFGGRLVEAWYAKFYGVFVFCSTHPFMYAFQTSNEGI